MRLEFNVRNIDNKGQKELASMFRNYMDIHDNISYVLFVGGLAALDAAGLLETDFNNLKSELERQWMLE